MRLQIWINLGSQSFYEIDHRGERSSLFVGSVSDRGKGSYEMLTRNGFFVRKLALSRHRRVIYSSNSTRLFAATGGSVVGRTLDR
jgi:hypothetical protein